MRRWLLIAVVLNVIVALGAWSTRETIAPREVLHSVSDRTLAAVGLEFYPSRPTLGTELCRKVFDLPAERHRHWPPACHQPLPRSEVEHYFTYQGDKVIESAFTDCALPRLDVTRRPCWLIVTPTVDDGRHPPEPRLSFAAPGPANAATHVVVLDGRSGGVLVRVDFFIYVRQPPTAEEPPPTPRPHSTPPRRGPTCPAPVQGALDC